jgi:hypothetical protein
MDGGPTAVFEARSKFSALAATASAALMLDQARERATLAYGPLIGGVLASWRDAVASLLRPMGADLRALGQSEDPAVRDYVAHLIAELEDGPSAGLFSDPLSKTPPPEP